MSYSTLKVHTCSMCPQDWVWNDLVFFCVSYRGKKNKDLKSSSRVVVLIRSGWCCLFSWLFWSWIEFKPEALPLKHLFPVNTLIIYWDALSKTHGHSSHQELNSLGNRKLNQYLIVISNPIIFAQVQFRTKVNWKTKQSNEDPRRIFN